MRPVILTVFGIAGAVGGYFLGKIIMGLFKSGGATMIRPSDVFWCYVLPSAALAWGAVVLGDYLTRKMK